MTAKTKRNESDGLMFNRTYSEANRASLRSRYAAAIKAMQTGVVADALNLSLVKSMIMQGLLEANAPHTLTPQAITWAGAYTGKVARSTEILVTRARGADKANAAPVPVAPTDTIQAVLSEMIFSEPRQWLHMPTNAIDILDSDSLWLWLWLQKYGDKYSSYEAVAGALSWPLLNLNRVIQKITVAGLPIRIKAP